MTQQTSPNKQTEPQRAPQRVVLLRESDFFWAKSTCPAFGYKDRTFSQYAANLHAQVRDAVEGRSGVARDVEVVLFDQEGYKSWYQDSGHTNGLLGSSLSLAAYGGSASDDDVLLVDHCEAFHAILSGDALVEWVTAMAKERGEWAQRAMQVAKHQADFAYKRIFSALYEIGVAHAHFDLRPVACLRGEETAFATIPITVCLEKDEPIFASEAHQCLLRFCILVGALHRSAATITLDGPGDYDSVLEWRIDYEHPSGHLTSGGFEIDCF